MTNNIISKFNKIPFATKFSEAFFSAGFFIMSIYFATISNVAKLYGPFNSLSMTTLFACLIVMYENRKSLDKENI